MLGIMSMPIVGAIRAVQHLPPPLPVITRIPEFNFIDQQAEAFGSEQLRGKVWVANFIFTRCPTVCPLSTQKMFAVQHRARNLGEAFHIVSFSVDPEYDTPQRLADYAHAHRVSPRMWSFLTGDREALTQLAVKGLKMSVTREGAGDLMSIGHDSHFVLVDGSGDVRGYYESDEASLDRLMRDIGMLVNRGA